MNLLTLIKSGATNRDEAIATLVEHLGKYTVGLKNIDLGAISAIVIDSYFEGMTEADAEESIVINSRPFTSHHSDYTVFIGRVFYDNRYLKDVHTALSFDKRVPEYDLFSPAIRHGVKIGHLDPRLTDGRFDFVALSGAIRGDRSNDMTLLGVQTLYDRYSQHDNGIRYESIQSLKMRISMGLALNEKDPTARAIEFYNALSNFDYMASTPTLFNSGTLRPQLSSCYLTTINDDLYDIYSSMRDNAMLSKWAGGIGNDWSKVRALNSHIKGTNGKSQGTVPFLKVSNDTAIAVNQGGKRKGAICAYLTTWHLDVEEFLELRKNTGDDRRRTHDMNTANWVPDEFMRRVFNDEKWTLFTPSEVPELNELFGNEFEAKYKYYEEHAAELGLLHKVIKAKDLWRKMLSMLFETGHPWITFKDVCNIRSPQQHVGIVRSSNLCTEITLNTSADEIAVCNLGSVNLANHIENGQINRSKLERTINTAVRMLDNVIDINFYPVKEAQSSNLRHRPIGLGMMGFQDALYILGIPYGSEEAVKFADESAELFGYYATRASAMLARERGSYPSFTGSTWSKGKVALDTLQDAVDMRGKDYAEVNMDTHLGQAAWDEVRELVRGGMRNSNVTAIAPTASIANIVGVTQSIEPTFENIYVKSNLSGEFTQISKYLVAALEKEGLWSVEMSNAIKDNEGKLTDIPGIPLHLMDLFATAFEVQPRYIIEAASRRQKWLDQAQSLNLYIANADGKMLDRIYKMAWIRLLKTTYYLRAKGATTSEKSTSSKSKLTSVAAPVATAQATEFAVAAPVPGACSIDNPDCEACQ